MLLSIFTELRVSAAFHSPAGIQDTFQVFLLFFLAAANRHFHVLTNELGNNNAAVYITINVFL